MKLMMTCRWTPRCRSKTHHEHFSTFHPRSKGRRDRGFAMNQMPLEISQPCQCSLCLAITPLTRKKLEGLRWIRRCSTGMIGNSSGRAK